MIGSKPTALVASTALISLVLWGLLPQKAQGQGASFPDAPTSALRAVPLGAVLDYWDFSPVAPLPPPFGFAICDGSPVTEPMSPFFGLDTPDLRDRFIRGTDAVASITDNGGGAATVNLSHSHGLGGHTHSGTTEKSNNDITLSNSPAGPEGVPKLHTHDFTTGPASGSSDSALGTTSILPPYARLLKIVRVL